MSPCFFMKEGLYGGGNRSRTDIRGSANHCITALPYHHLYYTKNQLKSQRFKHQRRGGQP